ncbi:MAG: hypothetical protein ACXVA9_11745 [Bdellovibrionales bacterium]
MTKLAIYLALFLGLSVANALTVKECTISSMMPLLESGIAKLVNDAMTSKRISYLPSSLKIQALGKESWQEFKFLPVDEENAYDVTFGTEKGGLMKVVTPQDKSYGDPQLREKLTLLIPNPKTVDILDNEGNVVKRECRLLTHQGYNRYLFIINTARDNFIAFDELVSCGIGCGFSHDILGVAELVK